MLTRLYDRMMTLARHRRATSWLAAVSFAESSVFPIAPDVMLIPMVLADRATWLRAAAVCTIASVLGGLAGYAIGYALWEAVGRPLIAFYGYAEEMADFTGRYNDWGAWIVFVAGVTPIPYKVVTIASGVAGLDLVIFTVASTLARGLRFFVIAALLYRYGAPIEEFIRRHLGALAVVFVVLLIAGFVLAKYLA